MAAVYYSYCIMGNGTVSSSDYAVSNVGITDELKRTWIDVVPVFSFD
jgi:hypothetical protein